MQPLTVLAITQDTGVLHQVRVVLPLSQLVQAGLVAGFRILNPLTGQVSGHFEATRFDALLLQRETSPAVVQHLVKHSLPFLFDLDDLLLSTPAYSQHRPSPQALAGVVLAVKHCRTLGLTSGRLGDALERMLGLPLAHKTVLLPNASPLCCPPARPAARPQALLWTSSDLPALTASARPVVQAVSEFAARTNLPVLTAGAFPAPLANQRSLGCMDYWQHKHFLSNGPPLIGLAPLETQADPDTLEFIACKSDVKMVEYAGAGHTGVYSQAPPYARSDLGVGMVVPNTREAWLNALHAQYDSGWRQASDEARKVYALRNACLVARQCWLPALESVRLERHLELGPFRSALLGAHLGATGPEPLHHRLADVVYYGAYARLTPDFVKRRVGQAVERLLDWANRAK